MAQVPSTWLASAAGIFFGWAFLSYIVRVWARLRVKAWGMDDYAISGSMLVALIHLVCVGHALGSGYGQPPDRLSALEATQVEMGLYLAQISYVVSFGLCRLAAALFIAHVAHHAGPLTRTAQTAGFVAAAWTVASALALGIRGDDVARPWTLLDGSSEMFARWLVIETTGILIDLALWAVAARLVCQVQLKLSTRIMLVCAFGAGCILVTPLLVTRLVLLHPRVVGAGPACGITTADLLTEACVHLAVFAGSATALKPLLASHCHARPLLLPTTTTVAAVAPGKDWTSSEGGGGRESPCWHHHRPGPAVLAGLRGGGGHGAPPMHRPLGDVTWQRPAARHVRSNDSSVSSTWSAARGGGGGGGHLVVADYHRLQQDGGGGGGAGCWRRESLTETLRIGWAGGRRLSTASDDSGPIILQSMSEVRLQDAEDRRCSGEDAASVYYMAEEEGGMF